MPAVLTRTSAAFVLKTPADAARLTFSTDAARTFASGSVSELTGEALFYMRTDTWFNGSPMTPAKICPFNLFYIEVGGVYYKLGLPGGRINLALVLPQMQGQNPIDCGPLWQQLVNYFQQAMAPYFLHFVLPQGKYWIATGVVHAGLGHRLDFEGGILYYPGGVRVLSYLSVNGNFQHLQYPRGFCVSPDPDEGYIDPRDTVPYTTPDPDNPGGVITYANYRDWLTRNYEPLNRTFADGTVLEDWLLGKHGNRLASKNPDNYTSHFIFSTCVTFIDHPYTEHNVGCTVYLKAPAIQQHNAEAPDGYNTSLSRVFGGQSRFGRAPAICVRGADANQITISNTDTREGETAGILALGQSGTHLYNCHSAVNGQSDYDLNEYGNPSLNNVYTEVNNNVSSTILGNGVRLNGAIRTGLNTDFAVLEINGNNLSKVVPNLLQISNQVVYGDPVDRYHTASETNVSPSAHENPESNNWRRVIGGQVMSAMLNQGETTSFGQRAPRNLAEMGGGSGSWATGQQVHFTVADFSPPAGAKFLRGYQLHREHYGRYEYSVNDWECFSEGLWGSDTLDALSGGLRVSLATGSTQKLLFSSANNWVQLGDALILHLSGQDQQLTVTGVDPLQGVDGYGISCSISQPVSFTGSIAIDFPKARFRAMGSGRGTLAQRPTYLRPDDAGWSYTVVPLKQDGSPDYDNAVPQVWTGSMFKNLI